MQMIFRIKTFEICKDFWIPTEWMNEWMQCNFPKIFPFNAKIKFYLNNFMLVFEFRGDLKLVHCFRRRAKKTLSCCVGDSYPENILFVSSGGFRKVIKNFNVCKLNSTLVHFISFQLNMKRSCSNQHLILILIKFRQQQMLAFSILINYLLFWSRKELFNCLNGSFCWKFLFEKMIKCTSQATQTVSRA